MSRKVWRATGEYRKNKRKFKFSRELIAINERQVRERVMSELGSRHRVKRRDIVFHEIKEIRPEDVKSLDIRRLLGVESVVG